MSAQSASELPLLLTMEEVALCLNIGRTRVYRLVASGLLVSVKVGRSRRVPKWALEELVNRLIDEPRLLERF